MKIGSARAAALAGGRNQNIFWVCFSGPEWLVFLTSAVHQTTVRSEAARTAPTSQPCAPKVCASPSPVAIHTSLVTIPLSASTAFPWLPQRAGTLLVDILPQSNNSTPTPAAT